jgi:hypothetical protein
MTPPWLTTSTVVCLVRSKNALCICITLRLLSRCDAMCWSLTKITRNTRRNWATNPRPMLPMSSAKEGKGRIKLTILLPSRTRTSNCWRRLLTSPPTSNNPQTKSRQVKRGAPLIQWPSRHHAGLSPRKKKMRDELKAYVSIVGKRATASPTAPNSPLTVNR